MLWSRIYSPTKAEEAQDTSEKFTSNENDFDSESDGEWPHLIGKVFNYSDSSSDDSDVEEDCKHTREHDIDDSDGSDGEAPPMRRDYVDTNEFKDLVVTCTPFIMAKGFKMAKMSEQDLKASFIQVSELLSRYLSKFEVSSFEASCKDTRILK